MVMEKYLVCLIISIIIGNEISFAYIEHIVAEGETIDSIAGMYGMDTEELLEANTDASAELLVGQRLRIPEGYALTDYGEGACQSMISSDEQNLSEEARNHFSNEDWGKAVKIYDKLIKNYPRSIYYYNRALAYLSNNKNRQAANDFNKALSMDDCTPFIIQNAPGKLAEAERRHGEWKNWQLYKLSRAAVEAAGAGCHLLHR